jgi:hypothetical protein
VSLQDRMQRIDGAGHAASAFMKSAQNGIECDVGSVALGGEGCGRPARNR